MKNGSNDPLHGRPLQYILEQLLRKHGWQGMHDAVSIKCFSENPSISSSLKFLRKTPWARKKVEEFYIDTIK